jgi:hypothetical protein
MKTRIGTRFALGYVGAAALLAIAAASLVDGGSASEEKTRVVWLSLAKEYHSLAELRQDAEVVAVVQVLGEPNESARVPDAPTVDVRLRVERVLKGAASPGDSLLLVQFGDLTGRTAFSEPLPPVLLAGQRYLLFMNRQFPDQPQMVLTGLAGVYRADVSTNMYRREGSIFADLPEVVVVDKA